MEDKKTKNITLDGEIYASIFDIKNNSRNFNAILT